MVHHSDNQATEQVITPYIPVVDYYNNDNTDMIRKTDPSKFLSRTNQGKYNIFINMKSLLIFVITFLLYMDIVHGFNVDTRTATVHSGTKDTLFGFSVAQLNSQWIVVGAPLSPTPQAGVRRAGAVYQCRAEEVGDCEYLTLDSDPNEVQWNGTHYSQIEEKSHQFLGATLHAQNGGFVACAPRYTYFTRNFKRRQPVGTCFVWDPTEGVKEYSPCKGVSDANLSPIIDYYEGLNQCGFSALLQENGRYLVMGAVGSYYWQGQLFNQDLEDKSNYYETNEGPSAFDDGYMGYSVTTGNFDSGSSHDIAVGIPKADGLKGKVALWSEDLTNMYNVSGEQMGEYFGYSVAAADFNGDGLDDLAVGAPFYTDYETEGFDRGRAFVFYRDGRAFKPEKTILTGNTKISGARFGTSVAIAGDLNLDNYNDLVVGAPYDGPNNQGAVYVFHGSANGIISIPSQVVQASDISINLQGFGFDLSAGIDQDRNQYPDVVVGSYESDQAVYLKSRPIIKVEAEIKVTPPLIDLETRECDKDGLKVVCFRVNTCVKYKGLNVPGKVDMKFEWTLDTYKNLTSRAFFLDQPGRVDSRSRVEHMRKIQEWCTDYTVFIRDTIRDKLNAVPIQLTYQLVHPLVPPERRPLPVLDQYGPTAVINMVDFKKNCGKDLICIPDLVVTAYSHTTEHILKTVTEIQIDVIVENIGEDAYEAMLFLELPKGSTYVNLRQPPSEIIVSCTKWSPEDTDEESEDGAKKPRADEPETVMCDIGNPLRHQEIVGFTLRLSASDVAGDQQQLRFQLKANSTNPEREEDYNNNVAWVNVVVVADAQVIVSGVSNPEQILYNATMVDDFESEEDVGPEVVHLYEVQNTGPSDIESALFELFWPQYMEDGSNLLYLPEVPQVVRGEGSCTAEVNAYNLTVKRDQEEDAYSYLINEVQRRFRRQTYSIGKWKLLEDLEDQMNHVGCDSNTPGCSKIICEIGNIKSKESILIQTRARVWINTIIKHQSDYIGFRISSEGQAQVMSFPYEVAAKEYSLDSFTVETFISAIGSTPTQQIKFWVIALAIIGGCILLLILVWLLWMCGFFHRKKKEEKEELLLHRGKKIKNDNFNGSTSAYKYEGIPKEDY